LLRLDSLPKAKDNFAHLEALGGDEHGYYVIVDGGGRLLLSDALASRDQYDWLRRIVLPATRSILWKGLHRIAAGLVMLHEQGVLHRALGAGCIFADADGEGDFRLSGFEWSLRLSTAAHGGSFGAGRDGMRAPELTSGNAIYSVASDWFDFGLLAAEIVGGLRATGSGLDALNDLRRSITAANRVLSEDERRFILGLLLPNPDARRVECLEVVRRIGALRSKLNNNQNTSSRSVLLGVSLSANSEFGPPIFRLSGGRVRIDDVAGQLAFIQEDVKSGATLSIRSGRDPHYALHGRQLSYRLRRYRPRNGAPTWKAAFTAGLDWGAREVSQSVSMDGHAAQVETLNHVEHWLKDPMARPTAWDQAFPFEASSLELPGTEAYEFLKFTNTIDALLAAARIWPITIVERRPARSGGEDCIVVEAAEDDGRDKMARSLGLETPAMQMVSAFVEEVGEIDGETIFEIADDPRLTRSNAQSGRWTFRATIIVDGARRYEFRRVGGAADALPVSAYLRPTDLSGSYRLLERRLKAIDSLRDQSTMLRALEAPGSVSRDTMEQVMTDASVARLDDTKQQALAAIWRAQPMFALQGPPGTGKTALVEAMVRQALRADPTLQFATTAQANTTVDNLGQKVSKGMQDGTTTDMPLVVRLDEDEQKQSALAPERLAEGLSALLEGSNLGTAAPPHIAKRLSALSNGSGQEGRRERGDMARLISRAANVVLSTTTSRGLSELLEEGKRFDWCLVEEAGKAHGFDLALPMLASHRLLMIGDHEQLPAFNERAYLELLENPEKARDALLQGAPFIPRKLGFDLGPMESDESMRAFEQRCDRWRPMVRTFGHVFTVSSELPPSESPIAARLVEQHRMHPEICDLVRACFYPDLRTADSARARLQGPDPFKLTENSWLPDERIVFVDMPWIQSVRGASGQDIDRNGRMVLSNKAEGAAVIDVLEQLVARNECDLQVLAPYNRQADLIRKALSKARLDGRLQNLGGFSMPKGKGELGATIDSFQGEEADVVVVSLVRNNHAPLSGGVGHLSERPRLNVMLSRARRKLILVGSWEFFAKRANDDAWKDPTHRLHHVATVFHELSEAMRNGTARKVSWPGMIAT
jgi:hypothetical protein